MSVGCIQQALADWQHGKSLSRSQAFEVLCALTASDVPAALSAGALVALNMKGVSPPELQGFADGMRHLAHKPNISTGRPIVDIVGTGGDSAHSFNLSTGAALLSAASGLPIVKHGNRAVSSRSGSADVLRELGLAMPMTEAAVSQCFESHSFAFLFAPNYHPAMKTVAPIRQALRIRTVFNLLGPLTNPASPPYMVLGAYSAEVAELMAAALMGMPITRAFVIHSHNHWDEPTPAAPFTVWDVTQHSITTQIRSSAEYGLSSCTEADLKGGDASFNANALMSVLDGFDQGAHRRAILLGAALALEVSGVEPDPIRAVSKLSEVIDHGHAGQWVRRLGNTSHTL